VESTQESLAGRGYEDVQRKQNARDQQVEGREQDGRGKWLRKSFETLKKCSEKGKGELRRDSGR